jgi:hypothetical protein
MCTLKVCYDMSLRALAFKTSSQKETERTCNLVNILFSIDLEE